MGPQLQHVRHHGILTEPVVVDGMAQARLRMQPEVIGVLGQLAIAPTVTGSNVGYRGARRLGTPFLRLLHRERPPGLVCFS